MRDSTRIYAILQLLLPVNNKEEVSVELFISSFLFAIGFPISRSLFRIIYSNLNTKR